MEKVTREKISEYLQSPLICGSAEEWFNNNNYDSPLEYLKNAPSNFRQWVAENCKNIECLRELAKDSYYDVRIYAARNINTPVECLRELAKDSNYNVRI